MDAISPADPTTLIAKRSVASVSFALFGTLLQRRCFGLEGLFERALQLAAVPERIKQMPDSFVQHRNLAQNRLRIGQEGKGKVSLVSGVTIETIYENFALPALGLPVSLRPRLIEAELAAEKELAVINPAALALIEQARKLGKRVGIVAESHWSPERIRAILAAAAPKLAFDFVYSSASPEVLESLSLFKTYLAAEGLKPAQAVHIGVDQDTVVQPVRGLAVGFLPRGADPREGEDQREIVAAKLHSDRKSVV